MRTIPRAKSPTPALIFETRKKAGLTQAQCARLIYKTPRAWQMYERGDRQMDLAWWELFNIKLILNSGA